MRIYLSGPMRSQPDMGRGAFAEAAADKALAIPLYERDAFLADGTDAAEAVWP